MELKLKSVEQTFELDHEAREPISWQLPRHTISKSSYLAITFDTFSNQINVTVHFSSCVKNQNVISIRVAKSLDFFLKKYIYFHFRLWSPISRLVFELLAKPGWISQSSKLERHNWSYRFLVLILFPLCSWLEMIDSFFIRTSVTTLSTMRSPTNFQSSTPSSTYLHRQTLHSPPICKTPRINAMKLTW